MVLLTSGRADVGDGAAHVGGERATERVDRLALLIQGHLGEHEHVPAVGSETQRQRILLVPSRWLFSKVFMNGMFILCC